MTTRENKLEGHLVFLTNLVLGLFSLDTSILNGNSLVKELGTVHELLFL